MKGRLYVTELRRRRHRRKKIRKFRERYLRAETEEERRKIIEKALRVNPYLTEETFLTPIRDKVEKQRGEKSGE